jgi:high-affinity iron transporter
MVNIEGAMAALRGGIARNAPLAEVQSQTKALDDLFDKAEATLGSNESSATASFIAAFTILLREGLEAMLIVIAMVAFLGKAGRRDMLPWVHAGWASALIAGGITWVLATWVISISGASRELTEGFGSLLAAIVLVGVGIWMHGKSSAGAWQRYVREKLGHALSRKSALFLFGLVFVVVYREVFETILFFAAIWSQGSNTSVIGGAAVASVALVLIGWLLMRYSRKLPIGEFFKYSSVLLAVLAVVLIGKAASALQEAGYLPINLLPAFPRVEILGLYPTVEGLLAQAIVATLLIAGFIYNNRIATRQATA